MVGVRVGRGVRVMVGDRVGVGVGEVGLGVMLGKGVPVGAGVGTGRGENKTGYAKTMKTRAIMNTSRTIRVVSR
jgi:hypothetical protein